MDKVKIESGLRSYLFRVESTIPCADMDGTAEDLVIREMAWNRMWAAAVGVSTDYAQDLDLTTDGSWVEPSSRPRLAYFHSAQAALDAAMATDEIIGWGKP